MQLWTAVLMVVCNAIRNEFTSLLHLRGQDTAATCANVHSFFDRKGSISINGRFAMILVFSSGLSMRSTEPINAAVAAALLGFNEEAVLYCRDISDADALQYAMDTQGCSGVALRASR